MAGSSPSMTARCRDKGQNKRKAPPFGGAFFTLAYVRTSGPDRGSAWAFRPGGGSDPAAAGRAFDRRPAAADVLIRIAHERILPCLNVAGINKRLPLWLQRERRFRGDHSTAKPWWHCDPGTGVKNYLCTSPFSRNRPCCRPGFPLLESGTTRGLGLPGDLAASLSRHGSAWDTVLGKMEFDAKGDIKQLDYVVYKWDSKGNYVEINPKGS